MSKAMAHIETNDTSNGYMAFLIWIYQVMASTVTTLISADTWMQRTAWGITIILGLLNLYIIWPKLRERWKNKRKR